MGGENKLFLPELDQIAPPFVNLKAIAPHVDNIKF
jgi:hypothetical protein